MISGVSFNGLDCYKDLGMILAQKEIGLPEVQTNYIDIPGMDGSLDLTEALTGDVRYKSRTLTLTFVTRDKISGGNWASFLSSVAGALHGQKVRIIFDDDPSFYYTGRCEIDEFETAQGKQTITLTCTCDPYKYDTNAAGSPWLWDPFSFVDGIIYQESITVDGETTAEFINRQKRVIPSFVCSSAMTVIYDGKEYSLGIGTTTIYEITFEPNSTTSLTFVGSGTVSVCYEGGIL